MDYSKVFNAAIDRLHEEGRYRVFIDILRNKGAFPNARCFAGHNGPKPITVWCSNDYLGMGQHPKVISAMEAALHDVGAGSGGTRNIGGNTHYHVDLEGELAKHDRVVEAAVVGVQSEKWGETPVGFVVLKPGVGEDALEDIRSLANSRLGKTQRVAELYAIDEMPRSHIGKLLKTDLRELVPVKPR